MAREKRQQLEFLRRQPDLFFSAHDAVARNIDFEIAHPQIRRLIVALHAVAQRRAQPRHQFTDAERLIDEIVGAEIERLDLLGFAVARGQHDDRHVRPFARTPDHFLAVAVGETKVEHDDIGRVGGDAPHSFRRCARGDELVAIGLECGLEKAEDRRLVVDHEHACLAAHDVSFAGASSQGNVMVMRVPRPLATGLSADIVPPCASMMPLAMASPSPVPCPPSALIGAGARKNFSNTCCRRPGAIPGPSSVTRITTCASETSASTTTRVSFGVWAMALPITLPSVCSTSVASAFTSGRSAEMFNVIDWLAPRRRTVPATRWMISRRSTQSRRNSSAPASMRVMARRLRTMLSRSSASCLISERRPVRAVRSSLSP